MTTADKVGEAAERDASSASGEPDSLSIDAGSIGPNESDEATGRHVPVPPGTVAEMRCAKRAKGLSSPRAVVASEQAQTLREQLIARGVIKPVEVFQARARELNAELLRAEKLRTEKRVDAGASSPERDARKQRVDERKEEIGESKGVVPKERRLSPSELSKAEKKKVARARLKSRQKAHENGQDANRYFFCMICGERYLGSENEAHWKEKHPEKFKEFTIKRRYVFSDVLRGRSAWIHVYQGGLPGLGKRR